MFYTMNRRRSGEDNWYLLPLEDRARLASAQERIERAHPAVRQVISNSVGFETYECGVDLYADDPVAFKRMLSDVRFEESSARYLDFGPAWSGVQFSSAELRVFLDGDAVPALELSD
jgi:chlorite dismutase